MQCIAPVVGLAAILLHIAVTLGGLCTPLIGAGERDAWRLPTQRP